MRAIFAPWRKRPRQDALKPLKPTLTKCLPVEIGGIGTEQVVVNAWQMAESAHQVLMVVQLGRVARHRAGLMNWGHEVETRIVSE